MEWLVHVSPRVVSGLVRASASLLRAPLGVLTMGEAGSQQLCAHAGPASASLDDETVARIEDLCAQVVSEGRALTLRTADTATAWTALPDPHAGPLGTLAGAPVRVQGRTVGVLAVLASESRTRGREELQELGALSDAVAAELERARLEAERARLAAAVQRTESLYFQLTQTTYVCIYTSDLAGRVTFINETGAKILGRPTSEIVGKSFRDLMAPEDRETAERLFRKRLLGVADAGEVELRVVRPTGERRILQTFSGPVLDNGRVVGIQGVARDITEDRAREMQHRRTERMAAVAPLLSGVCHELNNPLTSIKSFAELLLLDERSPEDREALEIVKREAHRAAKIVTDLRQVAYQSQETATGRGPVSVNAVVRQVLEARGASHPEVAVRLDLADGLPDIWAVRRHVEQVVMQLVSNAMQAMQEHPGPRELTVRTYASGLGVVLQVQDCGPGIPAEQLDRIFDPFWTTRRAGEGTGLGLSLVHRIVTDHGGRIRVDSAVGRGTEFLIELPTAVPTPTEFDRSEPGRNANRSLRILVVDDEAAIRYSLSRYMERRGHRVDQADEGGAALCMLDAAKEPYDVIVADLRMPGLNGGDLARLLRERQEALEERLIFITGDADSSDMKNGAECAGVPVVQKPFELAEIAQIIEAQAGVSTL